MASWARKIVKDPNGTTPAELQELRDTGLTDPQIFAITAFVALRRGVLDHDEAPGFPALTPNSSKSLPPAVDTVGDLNGRPAVSSAP